MRIRQLFKTISAFAIVAILFTPFTSCGDDDNNGGEDPAKVQTPKSAMALYQFEASQDMIDLLDITISYVDKGEIKTETMKTTKWTATANGLVLPATFGYRVHMSVKDNADFSKGSFDLTVKTYCTQYAVYDQDNERIESLSNVSSTTTDGGFTNLDEATIRNVFADREYIQVGFEIGTDGKYAKKTINW